MVNQHVDLQCLGDPVFEAIACDPHHSFYWHTHGYPAPVAKWNYHPEYELHLIRRSQGHYIVGDYIGRFEPGNLVLVGPNLPHSWFSDLTSDRQVIHDRDVVLQFRSQWLASLTQVCPELQRTHPMIKASARGIAFTGAGAVDAAKRLEAMHKQNDISRVAALVNLLGRLTHTDYRMLASRKYYLRLDSAHREHIAAILKYVHRHFNHHLSMAAIARSQGMTPPTFSRLFKQATGDTFTAFVQRLRIDHACRLLADEHQRVSDIGAMAGYSNLSNFNRHFRRLTGMSPREYRRSLTNPLEQDSAGRSARPDVTADRNGSLPTENGLGQMPGKYTA